MILNFSNHSSSNWSREQIAAIQQLSGEEVIFDLPFPPVAAESSEAEIRLLAIKCTDEIVQLSPSCVMCQGEFALTFAVVAGLMKAEIPCYAACTEHKSVTAVAADGNVTKSSLFNFVRFREYTIPDSNRDVFSGK